VVLALPEDMLTTPTAAPVLPRVSRLQAWPAPAACATCAMLLAAERPFVIAGGSGWDAEAAPRCSALPRTGSCRWAAPSASRTPSTTATRYAGDVGIGINPKLAQRIREPTWCSPSACAWAR
jgi:acetolactate synthase-1/2/3 large subunit